LWSLRVLPSGDELLARGGIGGNAPMLLPRGADVAASAENVAGAKAESVGTLDSIRVLERGPVRSLLRIERTIEATRLVQDVALYANSPELTIHSRVEGARGAKRLATAFELKKTSPWIAYGVPFGSTAVPTARRELAREIQALDWISQGTPQVSFTLCDDAGASFGAAGRTLSITLDDPDVGAERAPREVDCALHVERENWRTVSMHAAAELEHPPQILRTEPHDGARLAQHSFLSLARLASDEHAIEGPRSGLLLSAFKPAEDDNDWVLRVYEVKGESGTVRLTFDRPVFAAHRTDLLEHPIAELPIDGNPVEIPIGAYRIETLRVSVRPR
jgi:alpha-mannosidase